MIYKRDRAEVMPGQMEQIMEAAIESLEHPDGAGSDLESFDDHDYQNRMSEHYEPFVEVHGSLDLPQLIREIVAKWEEVRIP